MSYPHSKTTSKASAQKKERHYDYEKALAEGREAGAERYASMLVPVKFQKEPSLEEAWLEGFRHTYQQA